MKRRLTAFFTLALLAMSLLLAPRAQAFDTGPHADMTEEALRREGFGIPAIHIVQLQNWYVDYFSGMEALYPDTEEECAKLHFDNFKGMDMSNASLINNYWSHLTFNTRRAIQQAVVDHDEIALLTYVGMSLHAVQDFYSHSNWVECHERHPGAPYRTETWFNSQPAPLMMDLRTGHYPNWDPADSHDHGDFSYGTNHDAPGSSIARSRFDEAYFFAFVASMEWVKNCKAWADEKDPNFWSATQQIQPQGLLGQFLAADREAMYRLSEWAPSTGGHWKGPGSSNLADFIPFSLNWVPTSSPFKQTFIKNPKLLTDGLTSDVAREAPFVTPFRSADAMFGVVKLSTDWVEDLTRTLDDANGADFYPVITIGGQTFIEAMQLNMDAVRPPWETLKIVDLPIVTVPIHIELWDEDGAVLGGDDLADINPSKNKVSLDFDLDFATNTLSGDVTGVHNIDAVSTKGENDATGRSLMEFRVAGQGLAPVKTIPDSKLSLTIKPSSVSIDIGLKWNEKLKEWIEIDQSVKKQVTITAVDAITNLPLQGLVYKDSAYGASTYMGKTGVPFEYAFSTSGGSRNVGFRVYVPGYASAVTSVWVEVKYPDWY